MPTPLRPVRLNKFLATRLGVSRREADEMIEKGHVSINGKKATLGDRVTEKDKVSFSSPYIDKNGKTCYNKKTVPFAAKYLYLKFYKPVGYVCSRRAQGKTPTLYELLPAKFRQLKTVGRLDKDSSGLILLTNDGDFAYQMTHPKFHKEKIYEVTLDQPLAPIHQQIISDFGVQLEDGMSKFLVMRDEDFDDRKHFIVKLSEGRNRQIRRTFAALGYKVVWLHRVQFGQYDLGDLKEGEFVEIERKN